MRPRLALALPLLALLLLPTVSTAQRTALEPPVFTFVGAAQLELGPLGGPLPVSVTPQGPLFALPTLVERLGGKLSLGVGGQGYVLTLGDKKFLFGADSDAVVVDQEIITLSQRPWIGEGGIQVPLDLLERTFGEEMGNGFEWDSGQRVLSVDRRRAQQMPVLVDAVHVRGATTLVLEFPARPRYRIVEDFAGVEVRMMGDRIDTTLPPLPVQDPLVRAVRVSPERIRVELDPAAKATHYVLNRPFRLVFDIHVGNQSEDRPQLALPRDRPGVHTIVIDPGHGGEETGAIGAAGTLEKDLTLALARSLEQRLESRMPVRVVLTRSTDELLELEERTAIANENKADLFISLHLNSSMGNTAYGAETYFLSLEASDAAAAASAEAENRLSSGGGAASSGEDPLYDLQLMLWDLAQNRHLSQSQSFAKLVQEELNTALGLRDRGVKQAPFTVLNGAAMPAVLVEFGFLSNPEEESKLNDPAHRSELVEAMVRAVRRYRALHEAVAEPESDDEVGQ